MVIRSNKILVFQKLAEMELKAKMKMLAAEMIKERSKFFGDELIEERIVREIDRYKFNINDWVRLRILFLPTITSSLGFVEERKHIQFVTAIGIYVREYYVIKGWNDGSTYSFPAWRLTLDKDRILTAKLLNESLDTNEDRAESANTMRFDAVDAMAYMTNEAFKLTGIKAI